MEIVKRPRDQKGFKVLPWKWIVERTFGWLNKYRRLSKDYEYLTETSETMIYISMTHLMLKRLAKGASPWLFRRPLSDGKLYIQKRELDSNIQTKHNDQHNV